MYQELPSKETFFGSKKTTADTSIVTNRIKNQLETIPELVKHIQRPKNEILKDRLLEAFNSAIKSQDVCIDITNIAKGILERRHIPIFLDKNLFNQRMIVCQ